MAQVREFTYEDLANAVSIGKTIEGSKQVAVQLDQLLEKMVEGDSVWGAALTQEEVDLIENVQEEAHRDS